MITVGPMGPGFFIFFQYTKQTGGGSGGGGGANPGDVRQPPQYISEELERKLYPSRKKYEKYKREDKAHLRKSVEAAYAEFIEDDPMLRLMSQEDKAYILAQDDIESIIIILLLA